jgi:hypothetical protein
MRKNIYLVELAYTAGVPQLQTQKRKPGERYFLQIDFLSRRAYHEVPSSHVFLAEYPSE